MAVCGGGEKQYGMLWSLIQEGFHRSEWCQFHLHSPETQIRIIHLEVEGGGGPSQSVQRPTTNGQRVHHSLRGVASDKHLEKWLHPQTV